MFIKKIIIDGFKSYGKRVEITGFDPMFNAITGFNGSGKSNILDAICFVLGLSKLELARCHQQSELIYKNGKAGVTTASVTMEIDNSDGKFAETEYRNSQTILVRREINTRNQSKYFIEGFCVTREKLLDFFQSVSLNIQNPHFLIMQGKIVQVVSMKPIEILSMIEETVGMSVYETKKKQSLNRINKCEINLQQINQVIEQVIKPKLIQLKAEEKSLNEYQNVCRQYEQMTKISIAFRYMKDKKLVDSADDIIQSNSSFIEAKEEEKKQLMIESKELSEKIEKLQAALDEEMGGDLKQLESVVSKKRNGLQVIQTNRTLKMDNMKEEQNELDRVNKSLEQNRKQFEKTKQEYEKLQAELEALEQENKSNEELLQKAQADAEAIACGLSKNLDGDKAASLADQLMDAKDKLSENESKINMLKLRIQNLKKELSAKKQEIKSDTENYEKSRADIETKTKELKDLERELKNIDFSEERFTTVKQRLNGIQKDLRSLEDGLNQLKYAVPMAKFECPFSDINQDHILGVVCDLFTVKHTDYQVAIEKVCGGRLFNLVVSDDEIGAALIRKNLKERRTYLPLNRITGRDTDLQVLRAAERLVGKGNVDYAINLVSYDPELHNAMKYVFGDTLVCPNMEMARKVAFARDIMKRTITYDGEIYDPSGTLTGGALKKGSQTLATIGEIRTIEERLNRLKIEEQQFLHEYQKLEKLSKQYFDRKSKYDLKLAEIEILNRMIQESRHGVLNKEIENLEAEIQKEQSNIEQCLAEKKSTLQRIKDLEYKSKHLAKTQERESEEAKQNVDNLKQKLKVSLKKMLDKERTVKLTEQVFNHVEETIANLELEAQKFAANIKQIRQVIENYDAEIEQATKELNDVEDEYNRYKNRLSAKSKEITKLQNRLNELNNGVGEIERLVKMKLFERENIQTSIKEAKDRLRALLRKHHWIEAEESLFDSSESEYRVLYDGDFREEEFFAQIKALKSKKDSLSKMVNMKANIMQGEKQKEFEVLLARRDIIQKDRRKLFQYIDKIEKEKDVQLREAWEKINLSFGSIFSTLLPNSNAKLVPVTDRSIREGLEIKVAFGDVWKESLSELSGGQRSLVALSLVLALLKYNPAPLYILDEIDAALDQSHTQNIGIMIKRHFKNAQFLIVSLKDDMFSHANVLFQTKFLDGYSTVDRITNVRNGI